MKKTLRLALALITLLFFLAYLKWLIKDRRAKKAAA
jgi:hypothetical protein